MTRTSLRTYLPSTLVAASVAIAVCVLYVAGPLAAINGLLQERSHVHLFSGSKYLLANTVLVIRDGLLAAAAGLALLAISAGAWAIFDKRCRAVGVAIALAGMCAWAAKALGLPVMGPRAAFAVAICWGTALAFFDRLAFRLALVPAVCLYRAIVFIGLPPEAKGEVFLAAAAVLIVVVEVWLRSSPLSTIAAECAAGAVLAGVGVAGAVHFLHGAYVASLDLGYTFGFVALTLAILLVGFAAAPAVSRKGGIAAVLGAVAVLCTVGGWALATRPVRVPALTSADGRPNIVWIVWDTARADALECYGAPAGSTPVAAALARQGVVFDQAITAAPWTLPSHASMFTGLFPRTHAACAGGYMSLHDDFKTIAEILRDAGYQTAAFSGNYLNVTKLTGLAQGFETFYCPWRTALWYAGPLQGYRQGKRSYLGKSGEAVVEGVLRWMLSRRDPSRPAFIFVNLLEPHNPYDAPPEMISLPPGVKLEQIKRVAALNPRCWAVRGPVGYGIKSAELGWQALRALYRAGIRYTDSLTAQLLRGLGCAASARLPDDVLLVLTSDHGEMLGEHSMSDHQFALYNQLLHVPLVMVWHQRLPAGRRVRERVYVQDLFATVCDAAGCRPPADLPVESRSLLGLASGKAHWGRDIAVAEYWANPTSLTHAMDALGPRTMPLGRFSKPLQAIYFGHWHYIRSFAPQVEALFDLRSDPQETRNVASEHPEICARARQLLAQWEQLVPLGLPNFLDGRDLPSPYERAVDSARAIARHNSEHGGWRSAAGAGGGPSRRAAAQGE